MKSKQAGFSVVELLIILVVIAGVTGAGYKVYHNRHSTGTSNAASIAIPSSASTSTTTTPALNANAGVPSNAQTITNALSQQADSEASDEAQADANDQSAATSANNAYSNLGGAYNESNF